METVVKVGTEGLRGAGQAKSLPETVTHGDSRNENATGVRPANETLAGLRLLVAYRQELVADEAKAIARVRESLVTLFPALERRLNWTSPSSLILVARYQTPDHVRQAGPRKIRAYLRRRHVWNADHVSAVVTEAVNDRTERVQGEEVAAQLVARLAADALQLREQIDKISRSPRGPNGWLRPSPIRYRGPETVSRAVSAGGRAAPVEQSGYGPFLRTTEEAAPRGGQLPPICHHYAGRRLGDEC